MGVRFKRAPLLDPVGEATMIKISLLFGLGLLIGVPLSHANSLQAGSTCKLGDRAKLFTEAAGDQFSTKLKANAEVILGQLENGRWQVMAAAQPPRSCCTVPFPGRQPREAPEPGE